MKAIIMLVAFFIVVPIVLFIFAWVPMLGWNYGLHVVYPNLFPVITYWQAFWMSLVLGTLIKSPTITYKD